VLNTGYLHHIERLMVIGNFMFLCEIKPDAVYNWFMELFIDSYDWVMVPNVYGMSQYADGGLMSTKPYISSSNYIMKMSNYKKGDWQQIWDALYWRFISNNTDFFKSNPRLSMMVITLNRMNKDKLDNHIKIANDFLNNLK
jgi:deoxyribodipyrimidine photolyase-related protein